MRVLVLGRTEILYDTARALAEWHRICGVITAPAAPEAQRGEADFEALATELNCPFLLTRKLNQAALKLIRETAPDIAVSVNWVSTIGADVIEAIPRGLLNAHLGDLPRYRGNAVAAWTLLQHEPRATLTLHLMAPGELDSGDILAQHTLELTPQSTIADLYEFAAAAAPQLFLEALDGLAAGTLTPQPQALEGAFRCYPRLPEDGRIDWNMPARNIDALVRASTHPFSGAYCYLKLDGRIRRLTVWESRVVAEESADLCAPGHVIRNDAASGESHVFTGAGILALRRVQLDGEPEFAPGGVWRSIRMRLSVDVEAELLRLQQLRDRR